jgi:hypothetical protein
MKRALVGAFTAEDLARRANERRAIEAVNWASPPSTRNACNRR